MKDRLSRLLCGFRAKYSTQHALFRMLQKWQASLDSSGKVGAILMDLSKAFDSLPHDLLIAKLHAYGFNKSSLKLIRSYLTDRQQRTKVGSEFSAWLFTLLGVPQGSVLGPLLFNIFINDLILFIYETDICNFADDNTIYKCSSSIDLVIESLEIELNRCLSWFQSNRLVANPGKFQLMFLGTEDFDAYFLCIGKNVIPVKSVVKLLGIHVDRKLNFDVHINMLCDVANKKIKCLYRIRKFLDEDQALTLSNAYILSWFRYCPLIWMFCNKTLGKRLAKVQERCIKAIFYDNNLTVYEIMQKYDIASIHVMHLRHLIVEVFKSISSVNSDIMNNAFPVKTITKDLRDSSKLILPPARTVKYGINSVSFRSAMLWNSLPASLKSAKNVPSFKTELNKVSVVCSCQLCRV